MVVSAWWRGRSVLEVVVPRTTWLCVEAVHLQVSRICSHVYVFGVCRLQASFRKLLVLVMQLRNSSPVPLPLDPVESCATGRVSAVGPPPVRVYLLLIKAVKSEMVELRRGAVRERQLFIGAHHFQQPADVPARLCFVLAML